MAETRFWLVRHAPVDRSYHHIVYGRMDVPLCDDSLAERTPMLRALALRMPRGATWVVTPASRTQVTATALVEAGPNAMNVVVEPGFLEQDFGEWQGRTNEEVKALMTLDPHPFWPIGPSERPPGGESFEDVIMRVGIVLEHFAQRYRGGDVIVVAHAGTIRAALAHTLRIAPAYALNIAVQTLSLTRLDRYGSCWGLISVNDLSGTMLMQ